MSFATEGMNPHHVCRRALRETDPRRRCPEYVCVRLWRIFTVADEPYGNTARYTNHRVIGLSGNLAFGDVAAGNTATSVLTIANTGTGTLTVTGMSAPSAGSGIYKASWVSGTIAPGASQAITITFAPTAAISYNGTLTVNADQTSGTNTVPVSGAGSAASRVSLAGVVTSDAGERLSAVTLRVLDGANAGRTVTAVNGDYRFDNLAVGNANLSANASGFTERITGIFINGANSLSFTLVQGAYEAPVTFAVAVAVSPSPSTRVGAECNDGSDSSATGSGACSSHGGVKCWKYSDGACRKTLALVPTDY